MKREKKSAIARQEILDAALEEFSRNGYQGASLNRVCQEKGLSKGRIYHYFKDKDELYLLCVAACFDALTACLKTTCEASGPAAPTEDRLKQYFDARTDFFAAHPLYLGILLDVALNTPDHLRREVAAIRSDFDAFNLAILKEILVATPLRDGLSLDEAVADFRMAMTYFNLAFRDFLREDIRPEEALKQHEERSHRQVEMMLYGILERE